MERAWYPSAACGPVKIAKARHYQHPSRCRVHDIFGRQIHRTKKVFLMDPLPPDRPKISIGLNPFPEEMPLLASNGISFDCTNRSARLVGLHSAFRTCYRSFRRYRFSCNNLIDCILSEIRTVSYLNLTFLCFCYILYQQCRVFRDGRCKLSISETAVLKKWSAMKWFTHSRWMKLTRSLAAT